MQVDSLSPVNNVRLVTARLITPIAMISPKSLSGLRSMHWPTLHFTQIIPIKIDTWLPD